MAHGIERTVQIQVDEGAIEGALRVPPAAHGLVVFVHGSGSSRHSPRNQQVAGALEAEGLATLLFDLLTAEEDRIDRVTRALRFDIDLLARRVLAVIADLRGRSEVRGLPLGLFGASTGAAAALVAAALMPQEVSAVVSRGGRPDLAEEALADVRAPTLLVVGALDDVVIALNEEARMQMRAEVRLEIVPGATHLFEEPGALEHVSALAARWFVQHFGAGHAMELPPGLSP